MMIQPALATPTGVVRRAFVPRSVSRFTNMAASLLVVATIAFSGWFAAMNLRPGGDLDPRYTAQGIRLDTAGNDVCDVEPLTVEQAVQIVQDPLVYAGGSSYELRSELEIRNFLGAEPRDWDTLMSLASNTAVPVTDDESIALLAFVKESRDCTYAGTKGQLWAMTAPELVQFEIVRRIPLLQPMDVTEAAIAELLARPYLPSGNVALVTRIWQPNPDRTLMKRVDYGVTWLSHSSYIVPFQILNTEDEVLASYDIFGNLLDGGGYDDVSPANIVLTRIVGSWYIVGAFSSSQYADVPEE